MFLYETKTYPNHKLKLQKVTIMFFSISAKLLSSTKE